MIVLFLFIIVVSALASWPAWWLGRTKVKWFWWDYGVPLYGLLFWVVLITLEVGRTASLANLGEVLIIFLPTVAAPWLRFFFPGCTKIGAKISSFGFLLLPVAVALLLRLLMPTLPE